MYSIAALTLSDMTACGATLQRMGSADMSMEEAGRGTTFVIRLPIEHGATKAVERSRHEGTHSLR